jgi:hypothetical protein
MPRTTRNRGNDRPPAGGETPARLGRDLQAQWYVEAFRSTSARVRYACVVILVVIGVTLAGLWNTLGTNAFRARLDLTRGAFILAEECLAEPSEEARLACREEASAANRVFRLLHGNRTLLQARLQALEESYADRVLLMDVPVLGPAFDLNDLGMFSGVVLVIVLVYLTVSIDHQYQTLVLGLWKVGDLTGRSPRNDPDSDANLLYHALAMVPILTVPPTLYRWHPQALGRSLRIFFFLPFAVHALVVLSNLATLQIGRSYRPGFPALGIPIQIASSLILLVLAVVCCRYAWASERRWKEAFFDINPGLKALRQYDWRERLHRRPPDKDLKRRVAEVLGLDRRAPTA